MTKKQLISFDIWYAAEYQKYVDDPTLLYNLEEEMLKYCGADVEVLRLGFNKYRQTYMEMYDGIDPAEFITLPSYINYCYRALGMPENSIAVLPPRGYGTTQHHSNVAIAWLEWVAKQRNIKIKHARNSTEVKIGIVMI